MEKSQALVRGRNVSASVKMQVFTLAFIIMMSAFSVFENVSDSDSIKLNEQIDRHDRMMSGQSEYFNPWQYRVFSMLILEGTIRVFSLFYPDTHPIYPFLLLRLVQNVIIFYLCFYYYRKVGIQNPFLIWCGLFLLSLTFGNSSFHSDLSFNTYFDIIFYLAAASLILNNLEEWIVPLIVLASLNRETSGLICLMVLPLFSSRPLDKRKIIVAVASFLTFTFVFISLRVYYGYRETEIIHGMSSPLDFIQYNVSFLRLYPLLFGTLGFLPIIVILHLRDLPGVLRQWFWLVVPIWFTVHLFYSLAVETRLFLVPHTLLFLPCFLLLVERWYKNHLVLSSVRNL